MNTIHDSHIKAMQCLQEAIREAASFRTRLMCLRDVLSPEHPAFAPADRFYEALTAWLFDEVALMLRLQEQEENHAR